MKSSSAACCGSRPAAPPPRYDIQKIAQHRARLQMGNPPSCWQGLAFIHEAALLWAMSSLQQHRLAIGHHGL